MGLHLKQGTDFHSVFNRARQAAPEAFDQQSIRNLIGGEWVVLGNQISHITPVDQSNIVGPSMLNLKQTQDAVHKAAKMHTAWGKVNLDERKSRVAKAVELLRENRDTIA